MIFTKFLVSILITSFLALSSSCSPVPKPKSPHKSAKHGKAKKSKTAKRPDTTKKTETVTVPVTAPVKPGDQVNLEWVEKYDELLGKFGDKLTPPKQPGDRNGITVQGSQDIISPKVQKDFEILNALDKQKQ